MTTLTVIFLAAAASLGLARVLRIPPVPLLLLAGLLLALGSPWLSGADVRDALELGLVFLLFSAGTELSPMRFKGHLRLALVVAVAQFGLILGLSLALGLALGYEPETSLLVGLALAASSTLVVVRVLRQRRVLSEPFGRLVIGVLLVQDVIVMAFITAGGLYDAPTARVLEALGGLALLTGLVPALQRWVMPRIVDLDTETLILTLLGVLATFGGVAALTGLPVLVAAFLAGVSMATFPVNGLIRAPMASLGDFFLALFFVTLGATAGIPSGTGLLLALGLIAFVVLLSPPLIAFIATRAGLTTRVGVEAGLLLAQTSELSIVVAFMGLSTGYLDAELFNVITLITMVTMALTPLISHERVAWHLARHFPTRHRDSGEPLPVSDHVVIVGCGQTGSSLGANLKRRGLEVVIIDDDPAVVRGLARRGFLTLRGDGGDAEVLERARVGQALALVSTMRREVDVMRLLGCLAGRTPVYVGTSSPEASERVRRAGAEPVDFSAIGAETLVSWLDTVDGAGASGPPGPDSP